MSMDHSYRVFDTQPLEIERDPLRVDCSALETAVRRAQAAWNEYSRLRHSSSRTGDPAAACTAWMRVDGRGACGIWHRSGGHRRRASATRRTRGR
jgi:hypothetical protein